MVKEREAFWKKQKNDKEDKEEQEEEEEEKQEGDAEELEEDIIIENKLKKNNKWYL